MKYYLYKCHMAEPHTLSYEIFAFIYIYIYIYIELIRVWSNILILSQMLYVFICKKIKKYNN